MPKYREIKLCYRPRDDMAVGAAPAVVSAVILRILAGLPLGLAAGGA